MVNQISRFSLYGFLVSALAFVLGGTQPASFAQSLQSSNTLQPKALCIEPLSSGSFKAHFGYINQSSEIINLPAGQTSPSWLGNYFVSRGRSLAQADLGQPSNFAPGEHYQVFSVEFNSGERLNWILGSLSSGWVNEDFERCGAIKPFINCQTHATDINGDDYMIVHFGYINTGQERSIAANTKLNCLSNGPTFSDCDLGQPTQFLAGQHDNAVVVSAKECFGTRESSNACAVGWSIGIPGTNDLFKASLDTAVRECQVEPIVEQLDEGCSLANESGTHTATFGYKNNESFAVQIPVGRGNWLHAREGCSYLDEGLIKSESCPTAHNAQKQPTTFLPGIQHSALQLCFNALDAAALGMSVDDSVRAVNRLPADFYNYNFSRITSGFVLWNLGSRSEYLDYAAVPAYLREHIAIHYHLDIGTEEVTSGHTSRAPTCNAGSSYSASCAGDSTNILLSSAGSNDPDGGSLSYQWSSDCLGSNIEQPQAAQTTIKLSLPGSGQPQSCTVFLRTTKQTPTGTQSTDCSAPLNVSACAIDCLGNPGGIATVDICGTCNGDNTSCAEPTAIATPTLSDSVPTPSPTEVATPQATPAPTGAPTATPSEKILCTTLKFDSPISTLKSTPKKQLLSLSNAMTAINRKLRRQHYSMPEKARIRLLVRNNQALASILPMLSVECTGPTTCINIYNAKTLVTYRTNARYLKRIANSFISRMKRIKVSSSSSRTLLKAASTYHQRIERALKQVPQLARQCA